MSIASWFDSWMGTSCEVRLVVHSVPCFEGFSPGPPVVFPPLKQTGKMRVGYLEYLMYQGVCVSVSHGYLHNKSTNHHY